MKRLALFDFDGTLTTSDSFLAFIKFYKGKVAFWRGMILLAPMLILYKLKLIANWRAKELVLNYFFKGEELENINSSGEKFAVKVIPKITRKKAIKKLKWHLEQEDEVVVVTASATNWVKPWADQLGVKLISTELEVKQNVLTGKIAGKNCYGPEKVSRLCQQIMLKDYADIFAYGDSRGDKELLDIATHQFYRKF